MDAFHKAARGQDVKIPVELWNTMIDVCRAYRAGKLGTSGGETARVFKQTGIIKVKNTTGANMDRFAILGIDAPAFTPTDNATEFANRVVVKCVTPTNAHRGKLVVLLQALRKGPDAEPTNGEVGDAFTAGVFPAKVNVTNAAHQLADVSGGSFASVAGPGSASILWKESGTGIKWAILRMPAPGVLDVRWNATTHKLQATYVHDPVESDWVDKITFGPC